MISSLGYRLGLEGEGTIARRTVIGCPVISSVCPISHLENVGTAYLAVFWPSKWMMPLRRPDPCPQRKSILTRSGGCGNNLPALLCPAATQLPVKAAYGHPIKLQVLRGSNAPDNTPKGVVVVGNPGASQSLRWSLRFNLMLVVEVGLGCSFRSSGAAQRFSLRDADEEVLVGVPSAVFPSPGA